MQLVDDQVVEVKVNQWTRITDEDGKVHKVFPIVPGTIVIYASLRQKKNRVVITAHRGANGQKITSKNRRMVANSRDEALHILANLYGIKENVH
jgi:hypothetical protein